MFGVRREFWVAAAIALAIVTAAVRPAAAQQTPQRRETTESRQARINATIAGEYGHRWEIGGGGGYLRFRSGEYLRRNNEVTWQSSVTYFTSPKLGWTADVRGSFGDANINNNIYNEAYHPLINEYTFLFGPVYRFYRKEKWAMSVQGMTGLGMGNFDGGTKGLPSEALGLWQSATKPAFAGQVNLDYNFYPNLYFRLSPTVVLTAFQLAPDDPSPQPHGSIQPNAGVNFGVFYRFGSQKK